MSKHGKYEKKVEKKPLGWKKILLIVLAVILLLVVIAGALGWSFIKGLVGLVSKAEYQENELSQAEIEAILGQTLPPQTEATEATEAPTEETTEPTTEPTTVPTEPDYGEQGKIINIMLVGQAYREGEDSKLSDTMILCTLNRETNTLTMTSFLRDLYIQLPNYKGMICGENRINVCYNLGYKKAGDLGGMEMLDLLILNNFGVEVDYNIEIDFNALSALVNKLGGVTVTLDADEAKYLTDSPHCKGSFEEGENHIWGDTALTYARMRKSSASDNDIKRTARQRNLITQIISKCAGRSVKDLNDILKYILPMVLTDMDEDEIMEMAMIAIPMLTDLKIESNQCPAEGTYWGEIVNLFGYDSGVLKCNVFANKERLMAIAEEGKSVSELDAAE